MSKLLLTVPTIFGLEALVANEIRNLGYETTSVEDGRVTFAGDEQAICVCNTHLRTGERVLIKLGEFKALTFDNLFEGVKALPWEAWLPKDAEFPVKGHSIKSALFSIPDCQAIVKRAVVERLKATYKIDWFEETGAKYQIQFAIMKDVVSIYIDTTGEGLYKRGYREVGNIAPLRETLAAAIVNLSRWRGDRPFLDPLCGSGTIAIEAAMYAANIASGINRHFAAEKWKSISPKLWSDVREEARANEKKDFVADISASDLSAESIKQANENARLAGVGKLINFSVSPMEKLIPFTEKGAIACNPPYGERLLDKEACEELYVRMGRKFAQYPEASSFIITSHEQFEKYYGRKADKQRKMYNGMIKCYLYQYFKKR